MNCRHAENLIQAALDSRLGPGERSRLDAHIASCTACSTAWDDYRSLSRQAEAWTRRAISADDAGGAFTNRVMAQIATGDPSRDARPRWQPFAYSVLAAFALTAASFFISPIILSLLPPASSADLLPLRDVISPVEWRQMIGIISHDVLGAWGSVITAKLHFSDLVWATLMASLGINAVFIWWMRRRPWETTTR